MTRQTDATRKFYGDLLRCPDCGSPFSVPDTDAPLASGILRCQSCNELFKITGHIPRLLPKAVQAAWQRLLHRRATTDRRVRNGARSWFCQNTGLRKEALRESRSSRAFWGKIALVRDVAREVGLPDDGVFELAAMLGASRMARRYRKCVADQIFGATHATNYERYEDIILRTLVNEVVSEKPYVIIELGSGVGRLLHQYGSCLAGSSSSVNPYAERWPAVYSQQSLRNRSNLLYMVGLDFEAQMLRSSTAWMREVRLSSLITAGRMFQVLGSVQHLPFGKGVDLGQGTAKLVCILFQTIGNQVLESLRIKMLREAWELTQPNGLLVVSAFNRAAFKTEAVPYYESIRASVGAAISTEDATFFSERGVYSRWMRPKEIARLCERAGVSRFAVLNGKQLNASFDDEFKRYLGVPDQEKERDRAIVVLASPSESLLRQAQESIAEHA